jgi:hypothetical protein
MCDSDRKYLSRFALDPATEFGLEDLYGSDLYYDDEMDLSDVENIRNQKGSILEDDFLFEN